jgi:alkyl hydroperoxide reductase subunit AhpC
LGVERAVTRWYLQRQIILDEIAILQAKLNNVQSKEQEAVESSTVITTNTAITHVVVLSDADAQAIDEYLQQLAQAKEKLQALGACPRPMMG